MSKYSLVRLSDEALLRDLSALIARDPVTTAQLHAHHAEVDSRRLYLPAGYPSMHAYCVQELRLSESAANKRIRVARKAREVPALFAGIADGRLNLSGAVLLASDLNSDNADGLIEAAAGKTKSQIEELLAARAPRSEILPMVETIPASQSDPPVEKVEVTVTALKNELAPGPVRTTPERHRVEPIASGRFVVRVSLGKATLDKLHHA